MSNCEKMIARITEMAKHKLLFEKGGSQTLLEITYEYTDIGPLVCAQSLYSLSCDYTLEKALASLELMMKRDCKFYRDICYNIDNT
jgi:hypothetical protein